MTRSCPRWVDLIGTRAVVLFAATGMIRWFTLMGARCVRSAVLALGAHPVWLTALMALTVQTSFLMPPSGFAVFFLQASIASHATSLREKSTAARCRSS